MKSKMKKIISLICIFTLSIGTMSVYTPEKQVEASESVTPVYLPGFKHVTLDNFVNSSGNKIESKEYPVDTVAHYSLINLNNEKAENLDNTLLSFRMQHEGTNSNNVLYVAGTSTYSGFKIEKNWNGKQLRLNMNAEPGYEGYGVAGKNLKVDPGMFYFDAGVAGMASNFNSEFLLQVSIEYGNFPEPGVEADDIDNNDVRLGFYFDGKFYDFNGDGVNDENDKITMLNISTALIGPGFSIVLYELPMTLTSVVAENPDLTPITSMTPEYLPRFKHVTLDNFVNSSGNKIESKTYQEETDAHYSLVDLNNEQAENLDNTLLSFRMQHEGTNDNNTLYVAGTSTYSGFKIEKNHDGKELRININEYGDAGNNLGAEDPGMCYFDYTTAGMTSNFNSEFLLQISIEYGDFPKEGVDADNIANNDVKLGFYFNGQFYDFNGDGVNDENDKITMLNISPELIGPGFSIVCYTPPMTLTSVVAENPDLTPITWSDLKTSGGVPAPDKAFLKEGEFNAYRLDIEEYPENQKLDSTSFEAYVRFAEGDFNDCIYYAGQSPWYGITLSAVSDGNLRLSSIGGVSPDLGFRDEDGSNQLIFSKEIAGVESFLDNEFKLKITAKYIDYNEDDVLDAELGFFFNDKLYNNQYIYVDGYGADGNIGEYFGVFRTVSTIFIRSVQPDIKEISHNLIDGTYTTLTEDFIDAAKVYLDNESVDFSSGLSIPGDYEVKDSSDHLIGKVVLYQRRDVHPDGEINVKDLVAIKKFNEGLALSTSSTWAGIMGAYATDDFDETIITDKLLRGDELNGLVDFEVAVESGRDVRILQLTDTQILDPGQKRYEDRIDASEPLTEEDVRERLYKYIEQAVERTNPDLILITGDFVYGEFDDNGIWFEALIDYMDTFQIPWAPLFGNHENESTKGVTWQCQQFEESPYCLFKRGSGSGNSDYSIGITQDGELVKVIYMMDSNGSTYAYKDQNPTKYAATHDGVKEYNQGEKVKTTNGFAQDQVRWLKNHSSDIDEAYPEDKISKIMATHIPIKEFRALNEYVGQGELSSEGAFGVMTRSSNCFESYGLWNVLKRHYFDGVFVGHVHENCGSMMYDGIRLTYGLKTGTFDSYDDDKLGGTAITLDYENNSALNVEHVYYNPESK